MVLRAVVTTAMVSGMSTAAGEGETSPEAKRTYWAIGVIMTAEADAWHTVGGLVFCTSITMTTVAHLSAEHTAEGSYCSMYLHRGRLRISHRDAEFLRLAKFTAPVIAFAWTTITTGGIRWN